MNIPMKHAKTHKKPATLGLLRRMIASARYDYGSYSALRLKQYREATGNDQPQYPLMQDAGYQKHSRLWSDYVDFANVKARMTRILNVLDAAMVNMPEPAAEDPGPAPKPGAMPVTDLDRG